MARGLRAPGPYKSRRRAWTLVARTCGSFPRSVQIQVEGFTSMNQTERVLSPVFKTSALLGGRRSIDERETKSRNRFEPSELPDIGSPEEALVVDERSRLRPAQVVESKLCRLLGNTSLPVIFLLTRGIQRTR